MIGNKVKKSKKHVFLSEEYHFQYFLQAIPLVTWWAAGAAGAVGAAIVGNEIIKTTLPNNGRTAEDSWSPDADAPDSVKAQDVSGMMDTKVPRPKDGILSFENGAIYLKRDNSRLKLPSEPFRYYESLGERINVFLELADGAEVIQRKDLTFALKSGTRIIPLEPNHIIDLALTTFAADNGLKPIDVAQMKPTEILAAYKEIYEKQLDEANTNTFSEFFNKDAVQARLKELGITASPDKLISSIKAGDLSVLPKNIQDQVSQNNISKWEGFQNIKDSAGNLYERLFGDNEPPNGNDDREIIFLTLAILIVGGTGAVIHEPFRKDLMNLWGKITGNKKNNEQKLNEKKAELKLDKTKNS